MTEPSAPSRDWDGPRHECGIAAVYHLDGPRSPLCPGQGPGEASRLLPRMLLDIQNRGQLAAGMTSWNPDRSLLLDTYKQLGGVAEAFRLNHPAKAEAVMAQHAGRAAIGHVRYATCGKDDLNYAQPFEHRHLQRRKWFAFAFNGQLANFEDLKREILATDEHHVALDGDTEVLMHEIARQMSGDRRPTLLGLLRNVSERFDGAYSLALVNADGEMIVARDPLGMKPVSWAHEGSLFAAASESVALLNLGFAPESIRALGPGEALIVTRRGVELHSFAPPAAKAHCFFEWVYFANVASVLDDRSVYLTRKALGEELARLETTPIDADTVVVPVPDTSKAAADAMAYKLGVPCVEGLMRNRYAGRTFIEGGDSRLAKVSSKYTPLREVLEGKRVLLVEDSIVRSTTLRVLVDRLRDVGRVKEIHVRVACPPIVAPCFYGIDMSTVGELFAPRFLADAASDGFVNETEAYAAMARELGADSLRYLPVDTIARAIGKPAGDLCRACITGDYPTPSGQRLYQLALDNAQVGGRQTRTYEGAGA